MNEAYDFQVRDPVCGMQISPKTAEATAEYEGRTYYFCSVGCKESFVSNPEKYIEREQSRGGG